ncbi:MAG TPA: M14 family metallopeptidase [Usitatibacter sp.]|nr:M14 family metallopeptidase [Usitatibacter sp.]
MRARAVLAAACCVAAFSAAAASEALTTIAERSQFRTTGRYSEVLQLCAAFERAYPRAVRCVTFGRTPEGRAMVALVVSRTGALTGEEARRRKLPVVLIQGGIHAGEIDGKDAGFMALRDMLEGRAAAAALDKAVLVFVPVFNVDGHERFGRWNRPNQRGPEEMGWRTTAQNFNLNRDYVKADSPEMQAMLRLIEAWDPIACADLHVTDGARFQHDIAIMVEPVHGGDEGLRKAGRDLRDGVIEDLKASGSMPIAFYPSFVVTDDPSSGFEDGVAPPRFSNGYFYLRNRIGMLVETHSWRDYPARVRATRNTVVSVMERISASGAAWLALAAEADRRATALPGNPVALTYKATSAARTISFRGYEYSRTPSPVSGATMTRYDETKPQVWRVPLRDDVRPETVATLPKAGYVVPAAHAAMVSEKLSLHGIAFRTIAASFARAPVQAFRATRVTLSAVSTEGHQRMTLEGKWAGEALDIPAGSLFVPASQAKSRLVAALFEPQAPDSLAAWGAFATAFEKKEYMEEYVAEDVAREMLASDPALAAEFKRKLEAEPEFAKSKADRLEFFYRRHASWDSRYNLYPVLRVDTEPR